MLNREEALELFKKYNESESLLHHALCVEATMREAARVEGEDEEYWGIVGLLHDIDYGMYPDQHCKKAPELLEPYFDSAFIHAICSHGYGLCSEVAPELKMEKILYAIDELTGLVYATALMRPERMNGMSVKSVKKKWSSKGFAASVNRELISEGAKMCNIELPILIQLTIDALTKISSEIGL